MKATLPLLSLFLMTRAGALCAETAGPPLLDLHTCQRVVAALYDGRLPLSLDALTQRRGVQCMPGLTKPVLIHHEEHIMETLSAEEIARIRPAVQRTGQQNAMVRQRCAEPAFRALLNLADVAFLLHVQGEQLGTVTISAEMCASQVQRHTEARRWPDGKRPDR